MSTPDTHSPRTVAVFDSYAHAQRAVDHLSDQGFPVDRVRVVGQGLHYVEQVTGRMTTGRAALLGAGQGAVMGAILGLLVGVIFTLSPNPAVALLVLYGLVAGAILGAVLGAISHLATGGQRDFASVAGLDADRYELQVDPELAERAEGLLRSLEPARAGAPT